MNPILLTTWLEFFASLIKNPQMLLILLVVFLVILFAMSRLNNYMEVKGTSRAIVITRAAVGSLMWFVILPIVLFFFINAIAFINGVAMIDVSFLGKWLALTGTSYWWLLNCIFQNKDIVGQDEAFTTHSIIRILWILIPITIIWMRSNKKRNNRLMLIPFIVAVIAVARFKKAEETFITKDIDIETWRQLPVIGQFFEENRKGMGGSSVFSPTQRKIISGVLVLMLVSGLGVGVFSEHRVIGLVLAIVGVFGFMFLAPGRGENILIPKNKEHPFHHNIDSLVKRLDSVYAADGPESLTVYEMTVTIENAYKAQSHREVFPDSLCERYKQFFYDRCREAKPKR